MKANWMWRSCPIVALVGLIALELAFLTFIGMYFIPRFQGLINQGMIDGANLERSGSTWMVTFLAGLSEVGENYTTCLWITAGVASFLFEWRVKGENKPFIRLSALGTVALGLTVLVVLEAGSLIIPLTLAIPALGRTARPFAVEQVAAIDTSLVALELALTKKDWASMQVQAERASKALRQLSAGPAVHSLTADLTREAFYELREEVKATGESLREVQEAIGREEAGQTETALQEVRKSFAPVREAARRDDR